MARLFERRTRRGERQSTDPRARPHRRGPWRNANKVVVANNLAELHARKGDVSVFIEEHGQRINGQWTGSPSPVEHDADRIECRWHRDGRTDLLGLDVGLDSAHRAGRTLGLGPGRAPTVRSPRGIQRTRMEAARIRPRAAGPAGSIASRAECLAARLPSQTASCRWSCLRSRRGTPCRCRSECYSRP